MKEFGLFITNEIFDSTSEPYQDYTYNVEHSFVNYLTSSFLSVHAWNRDYAID